MHDIIFYEKQLVMNITETQRHLIKEYETVINALKKEGHVTVKDLHTYYFDPEINEYSVTIKTVYRYVEILENEGIIAHSGQRMTQGKRVNEKLYCLSAKFFHHSDQDIAWWDGKQAQNFLDKLGTILSRATDIPSFGDATAKNTLHRFFKIQQMSANESFIKVMDAMEGTKDEESIITENYFDDQYLILTASQLLTLIENQQLRDILIELITIYANAKAISLE